MELKLEDLAYQREAIDAVVLHDAPEREYPPFKARAKEVLHG